MQDHDRPVDGRPVDGRPVDDRTGDDRPAGAGRAIEDTAARLKAEARAETGTGEPDDTPLPPDRPGGAPAEIPDDTPGGPGDVPPELPDDPAVPQRDIPDQAGDTWDDTGDDIDSDTGDDPYDAAETVGPSIDRDRPLPL